MIELVVTSPFETFNVGDVVTDPGVIFTILNGPDRENVVEVNVATGSGGGAETITLRVMVAAAFQPLSLAGEIANASPKALDYSTDGGISWQAVGTYILAGDSWTGTGPVYGAAYSGHIAVRDHAAPGVVSATSAFVVTVSDGGGGGSASTGTLALGDGSVIDAIGTGLLAPQGLSAGSLSVAFGGVAGTVADGGMLSAEAQARQSGDLAGTAALGTEMQARQAADASAAAALGTESGARQAGDAAGVAALGTETQARQAGDAAGVAALGTETQARQAGDAAGATALGTETQARQAGDTAAATALATEASLRQAGDAAGTSALGAETLARQAGDAAGATALAAVQATAAAAITTAQRGAANGVAPLDGNALVPSSNMPAIGKLGWSDSAGTAAIFHRGPVPGPAPARAGMVLADRSKLAGTYNFAEIWDTQATYDAWPTLQNFLLYCQLMALAMKTSGIDNIAERNRVRAVLPRGAYLVSQPLIVPEFVDLDCRGAIYRTPYTGNQSNDGVNSVPGIFATNAFLPTVVVTPRAHAREINIYVNTVGGSNLAYRGSGVCIGKTWAAQVGAACTIGNPGTAYAVGDILYMTQPSVGPYFNWAAQVTAIGGGGGTGPITAATVSAAGAYALPPATYNGGPSLQQQQWTAANGFPGVLDPANPGCFTVHAAYQGNTQTASTGSGATLAPTWQADFVSGTAAYNIGSAITNGSQIGKIQITGAIEVAIDTTHGPTYGVMVTGLETVIGEIQLLGANAGIYGLFAQDVRIGVLNVVEAGVGVELFGCGSWHCPLVVLDTCGAAFLINETQGVRMGFRAFFEQNNITLPNAYPNSLGNAIQIGNASTAAFPCADIHLDGTLVNMGGLPQSTIKAYPTSKIGSQTARPMAASISLAWLFSSVIRVKVSNIGEQGGQPTLLPTAGFCVLGQGVDAGNLIEGMIDTVPTIDGVAPPAQLVTSSAGHAFPPCALRVWDGLHQCFIGPFGVADMFGATAPVNGASGTGANLAMPGSSYVDTASGSGRRYVNTGTQAVPAWS